MVSFGGLVIVNIIGVSSFTLNCALPISCATNYFNYAQIGLGAFCTILCITFIILINCSVGGYKRTGAFNGGITMNDGLGISGRGY